MKGRQEKPLSRRRLIQQGLLLTGGTLGLPGLSSAFAFAQQETSAAQGKASRWTIGSDRIARTLVFRAGHGLLTERLLDTATGVAFIEPGNMRLDMAGEFSLHIHGVVVRGSDAGFELEGADVSNLPNGKSLAIKLRHKQLGLGVMVHYRSYHGHPAVRKHLVLRNDSGIAMRITELAVEELGLHLGPANATTLGAQYGTVAREIFYTGRSEDAGLLLANSRTGAGVAIVSEVPGYMKRTEIAGWDDPHHVRVRVLYDTDLMPFERTLAPGQEFSTAAVSLVTFRKEDGLHDPHWVLPSYTAKVLVRRVDAQGPPWIYNTWEPFERSINREIVFELIEAAGSMGLEIFTIDDGWQQEYGDNAVNLVSFPDGLKPIQAAVEAKGMRLGLWLPLAAVGPATPDVKEHPEWAVRDLEGNVKVTGSMAGSKTVMCLASGFRDSAAARVCDAIERFHLAYVKLDITTIFNAYGEAPGCWAKGHDHGSWAESLNMIYEGIAYVTAKVYQKFPDVLLDLTFELWGQKHVIDGGLLAAGDLDWLSNVDDSTPDSAGTIQARQLLYQRAASMPVESMLIGNLHADVPSVQDSFATAIGSAPLLLGDLRKLGKQDRQWYGEKIAWFKALRRRTKISESFFPLGSWTQTSSSEWDGYARLAQSGNGILVLFRNQSGAEGAIVKLSVMPPGRFRLTSIFTGDSHGPYAQEDWSRGVPVAFRGASHVEVFEVTAVQVSGAGLKS